MSPRMVRRNLSSFSRLSIRSLIGLSIESVTLCSNRRRKLRKASTRCDLLIRFCVSLKLFSLGTTNTPLSSCLKEYTLWASHASSESSGKSHVVERFETYSSTIEICKSFQWFSSSLLRTYFFLHRLIISLKRFNIMDQEIGFGIVINPRRWTKGELSLQMEMKTKNSKYLVIKAPQTFHRGFLS